MNLKSKLRRTTAVVAGTLLGLTGVAVFAAPASAHHSWVEGAAECLTETGQWQVNWTVNTTSDGKAKAYRLLQVESTPTQVEGIAVTPEGADPAFPHADGQPLKGKQLLPGDATKATLAVLAEWDNDIKEWPAKTGTVEFKGTCTKDAPKPAAVLASSCEGVTVTLSNGADAKAAAVFTITGSDKYTKSVTVKAGADPVNVDIPAENAEKVVVTEKNTEKPVLEGKWEEPEGCQEEEVVDRYYEATCDSLTFTVDNTAGTETITVVFAPNKGDAKKLVVKAGAEGSVTFKGTAGLVVTPVEGDTEYEPIVYDEVKDEDCGPAATPATTAPAAGGQGGGDEPGLPVTGAAAGGIAGGAAALLAIGALLFVMARRRKVKFTA